MSPDDRKYTKEHEWLRVEDASSGLAQMGITAYAQDQLGDIVFVELPNVEVQVRSEGCSRGGRVRKAGQ